MAIIVKIYNDNTENSFIIKRKGEKNEKTSAFLYKVLGNKERRKKGQKRVPNYYLLLLLFKIINSKSYISVYSILIRFIINSEPILILLDFICYVASNLLKMKDVRWNYQNYLIHFMFITTRLIKPASNNIIILHESIILQYSTWLKGNYWPHIISLTITINY